MPLPGCSLECHQTSNDFRWLGAARSDLQNSLPMQRFLATRLINRVGVEDTRLEAKDTKKSEAKAKDSLSEDRHSRGQGQECSRPRPRTKDTSASALQKKKDFTKIFHAISKKKKVFTKIFQVISTKKRFPKNISSAPQTFNNSKNTAVLEPRTGQFSRT